jgi:hemerythrin
MYLEWTEELFGTGVDEIDAQHRELFDRVNKLLKAVSEARGADEIRPLMAFLGDYVEEHFTAEEEEMARRNCPVQEANKRAHDGFRERFGGLKAQVDSEDELDAGRLLFQLQSTVVDWISNHILRTDTQLRTA